MQFTVYIEPFFGSGAVLFTKTMTCQEIVNDINDEVYNLFKVIREQPNELATMLEFTPYSNAEYLDCMKLENRKHHNDVERARRFIVRANMAIGSETERKTGWRKNGYEMSSVRPWRVVNEWNQLPQKVIAAAERLKMVEIDHIDAVRLLEKNNQTGVLAYIDPPYTLNSRSNRKYYHHEFTEDDHIRLLDFLVNEFKGKVVLSGYNDPLYNERLKDWYRIEFDATAETGQKRTEVIWTNYPPAGQMQLDI